MRKVNTLKKKASNEKTQSILSQNKNIQRLQIYNTSPEVSDFSELHDVPVTVATTRPIPTLGQIYGNSVINSDIYNDFFLGPVNENLEVQFVTPGNSNNISNVSPGSGFNMVDTNKEQGMSNQHSSFTSNANHRARYFQSTNDNVRDWLSFELDHPTRDNESAKSMTVQETVILAKDSKIKPVNPLHKMNTDTKPLKPPNEFYATFKFPSTPNPTRKREPCNSIQVPSYIECPSEVLQRTTNFETDGNDTSSTGKDVDIQDDLSSHACEHLDDSSDATDQYDWRLPSSQCSAIFKSSKCSETTDGSWRQRGDLCKPSSNFSSQKCAANCSYHEYYYHYCWRKEVAIRENNIQRLRDSLGKCKKCQKYRRYSNKNNKISKRFVDLKNRIVFGRGCKHRWNRVWKKTTQRFTKWSKSPSKFAKFRMMHYLQRYNLDNAVVQTTVLVYNERGTDALSKGQRSAAITTNTEVRNGSIACTTSRVKKCTSSYPNHVNVGPSEFSFVKLTKLPMVSQTTSVEKSSPFQDLKTFKELIKLMDQSAKMRLSRQLSKSTSYVVIPSDKAENGTVTESLPPLTNKITSTLLHLKDQLPQNVCTQMIITCNNAATDIKFNPTLEASATTSELYCDSKLTEDFTSEHKSMMKSMRITPEPSNTKVSTGTITFDPGFLNTSSTVTDTVIPCKRLENKGFATLTTPKGTVLSCTGTKIISVSSVNLQADSVFYNRKYITNTAMSTNLISTRNMVCHTAPSLYQHTLKDACLGIDIDAGYNIMKNDETTSTTDITKALNFTIGVSTTKLVDKSSFNCGSPKAQRSFNADFRPSMHSMSTNTEWAIQSRALIISNVAVTEVRNTNMNDAFVQYSDKEKNDTPKSVDSGRIGRSRLMSVRMLGDSFSDVDTQAKPSMANAETHTTPKGIVSASMLTSHFAFDKTVNVMKASKENNTDTPEVKINKTWSNIPSRLEKQTDAQGLCNNVFSQLTLF
ncbi:uncharacterized protein LOC123692702 [Colias croceus]|uniref:uncharacterized protein LOC123692702 n=1 Tax=Colias crocea TaxID=72248 RepID=UPI001E280055|nr:uncharacterized protein LOC123692702 [Colias croceus]